METADISKQIYKFPKTDYTTVEFLALEIWTSEDAKKKVQLPFFTLFFFLSFLFNLNHYNNILFLFPPIRLSPSQRKCRLETESEELLTSSIYSFNLCRSQCRFRMALRECKCIPYFYRNVGMIIIT